MSSAAGHAAGPFVRGTSIALASALLFGATTPLLQRLGRNVGPITTAALLYAGAMVFAAMTRAPSREAPITRRHVPRLVAIALAGSITAPAALAWGIQRTSGTAASLLLNLEAAFTIVLGALLYGEHVGRRIGLAALAMAAGGAVLVLSTQGSAGSQGVLGLVAVAAATLGWALDNALTKPLSQLDPGAVVAAKGAIGAVACGIVGRLMGERMPTALAGLGLAIVGATGYGLSLRLYLRAQRVLGVGRTASVYAFAPFAGAILAIALGEPHGGLATLAAGALMLAGAYLHLSEKHEHEHEHEALEHEHAHRHDDGHHDHHHDEPHEAEHSHLHRHEPRRHAHPHAPDEHHTHRH